MSDRHERQLRKYNLTEEQWQALLDACDNHCPGCEKPFSSTRLPCADHDHRIGLVRGVLCMSCNWSLGTLHENVKWFSNMAEYLDNPPAPGVIGRVYVPNSIGADREQR